MSRANVNKHPRSIGLHQPMNWSSDFLRSRKDGFKIAVFGGGHQAALHMIFQEQPPHAVQCRPEDHVLADGVQGLVRNGDHLGDALDLIGHQADIGCFDSHIRTG
jgi:hypothetical protein